MVDYFFTCHFERSHEGHGRVPGQLEHDHKGKQDGRPILGLREERKKLFSSNPEKTKEEEEVGSLRDSSWTLDQKELSDLELAALLKNVSKLSVLDEERSSYNSETTSKDDLAFAFAESDGSDNSSNAYAWPDEDQIALLRDQLNSIDLTHPDEDTGADPAFDYLRNFNLKEFSTPSEEDNTLDEGNSGLEDECFSERESESDPEINLREDDEDDEEEEEEEDEDEDEDEDDEDDDEDEYEDDEDDDGSNAEELDEESFVSTTLEDALSGLRRLGS
eukprot:TRINITY_DN9555_c0_g2_i1.p1 TRINITY_DN9555_c0_g2~~TRINITY_DN9555_c0_g2_i1.p1  ORF type:complete len:276 (-),score=84.82 TRINITY_DN9555_c0_g2_i1:184-1011(-)